MITEFYWKLLNENGWAKEKDEGNKMENAVPNDKSK